MPLVDMSHFMGQDGGELFRAIDGFQKTAADQDFTTWHCHGIVAVVICFFFSVGYTFAFAKSVALESAHGQDRMPGWPEVSSFWETMIVPALQFLVIQLCCVAPGVLVLFMVNPVLGGILMLTGLFCLPMVMLTVTMAYGLAGLNPIIIFSGIGKCPGAYITACFVFFLLVAINTVIGFFLYLLPVPVLPQLITNFFVLYGLIVQMRVMGLFYYKYRERLMWFG